ncbi:hypothetical protein DFH07DRAFT_849824 [Mycena maculata]|uniref:SET domain-containing protein n=1 Tax=Mycena maculata TaxID=230809 RepID=A0AAD7MT97_9AGAR|nr:hypothetical protein DFH07DRAFT_849824 [Mycena maculata]
MTSGFSGKGKGLVAARDIKQGDLVIQEYPSFTVPKSILESPTTLISRLLQNVASRPRRVHEYLKRALSRGPRSGCPPRRGCIGHIPDKRRRSSAFNVVYSWRQREQAKFSCML